jgi:O-acetyl-ADP-ribose deacetylase
MDKNQDQHNLLNDGPILDARIEEDQTSQSSGVQPKEAYERLYIRQSNIVDFPGDAIVNAANPALRAGSGVCGAIFRAAGQDNLQKACDLKWGGIHTSEAFLTEGFQLRARYIIHVSGPKWHGGNQAEDLLLEMCYRNCIRLAAQNKLRHIAFPAISTGIYGFPQARAARIAVGSVLDELDQYPKMEVTLTAFDPTTFELYKGFVRLPRPF